MNHDRLSPSEPPHENETSVSRRSFLRSAGGALAATGLSAAALAQQTKPNQQDAVDLPPLHAATEGPEKTPAPSESQPQRTGYAVVGLGHLSLGEILPAFGKSKYSRVIALVSGDRAKAEKVAGQYGIKSTSIYDYRNYEQLAQNPDVQAIYIVLPNSMHAEYTERGAKIGKHILCEKPMATSARDCERMIAACKSANVKLMIAYRQQYEPNNREIVSLRKAGKLGALKSFVASNSQDQGDPDQWRQKLALAGGGCLPDVGVYCLNAARFLSGEEPSEVTAFTYQPKEDPRFLEVEESCTFMLRFPSGLVANCAAGYGAHESKDMRLRLEGGWIELADAFAYHGQQMRVAHRDGARESIDEKKLGTADQFALEIDHFADCIRTGREPRTPGEEGVQDHLIMEAIYRSAREGGPVPLNPPSGLDVFRGPPLAG